MSRLDKLQIDLNADVGEGMVTDVELIPLVSSANIACGFHAGDEATMQKTIELCLQYGVAIGAHPGFQDKENMGRKNIHLSADELYDCISKQLELMLYLVEKNDTTLHHLKLHGALYNMSAQNIEMASVVGKAIQSLSPGLKVYGLAGSKFLDIISTLGLQPVHEGFVDRMYVTDGQLVPRSQDGACIHSLAMAAAQSRKMIAYQEIETKEGVTIKTFVQTLCMHGDQPRAVERATYIRSILENLAVEIKIPN